MCTPSSLLTHRADRCLHHCGCAWRGVGGGCWGVGGMGWRGRVAAPVPPARCFPRTLHILLFCGRASPSSSSLSLLLISSKNSSIFFSLKPKIRSLPPPQPPLKFCHLQNLNFPPKATPISPHPFPRTLRILLFLRSARCWRGELGAPRVFPRCTFFYSTCIYHRDHSCAEGSPEAGSK